MLGRVWVFLVKIYVIWYNINIFDGQCNMVFGEITLIAVMRIEEVLVYDLLFK